MTVQLLDYTWEDKHTVSEFFDMLIKSIVSLGDQLVEGKVLVLLLFFILLSQQLLKQIKFYFFILRKNNWELNYKMLVWSISFEFTLDLHLVVLRVLNSKIKHRPHTDSESREVSIYFSWELTFSKVYLYFFLPLTRRQTIYAEVNFFT